MGILYCTSARSPVCAVGKIPWSGKWQPTPYFCLENPLDGGAWWATVHGGRKKSDTTERLLLNTRKKLGKKRSVRKEGVY